METLEETLYERVDELIRSHHRQELLSTTGSRLSIAELAARSEGHEKAIREIALEVQKLAASREKSLARSPDAPEPDVTA